MKDNKKIVCISSDLHEKAKVASKKEFRTISSQVEYWANIGIDKILSDSPGGNGELESELRFDSGMV